MLIVYRCAGCGEEFESLDTAQKHENACVNLEEKLVQKLLEMLAVLQEKHNLEISKLKYKPDKEGIEFSFTATLPNGNFINYFHNIGAYWFINSFDLVKTLEEDHLRHMQETKFEGIVEHKSRDDYEEYGYLEYHVGGIPVSDIFEGLTGRKVRIEVVE